MDAPSHMDMTMVTATLRRVWKTAKQNGSAFPVWDWTRERSKNFTETARCWRVSSSSWTRMATGSRCWNVTVVIDDHEAALQNQKHENSSAVSATYRGC